MTGTTLHQDGFQPQGCSAMVKSSAITALGGVQMLEMQSAAAAVNQTVVGPGSYTVSVGGYLTGGGHGLLSSRYGLATDQVLEMEVVTPQGEILVLNACQNQDLFWAMRGVRHTASMVPSFSDPSPFCILPRLRQITMH